MRLNSIALFLSAAGIVFPACAATYVLPAAVASGAAACPKTTLTYPAGSTFDASQVDPAHGSYGDYVTVDLTAHYAEAGTCRFAIAGFENAEGSPNGSTLIGNGHSNILHGHSGRDEIEGRGGDDTLSTISPTSLLYGGAGRDSFTIPADLKIKVPAVYPVKPGSNPARRYSAAEAKAAGVKKIAAHTEILSAAKDVEPGETVTRR